MAGITTSIELFDNMSNKLDNIINRTNGAVSSFGMLSRAMNSDVDVSGFDKVTNSIDSMDKSMNQSGGNSGLADEIDKISAKEERMSRITKLVDELEVKINEQAASSGIETSIDNITDKTIDIKQVTNNIDQLQNTINNTANAANDIDRVTNSIDRMNQSSGAMSNIAASSSKAFDTNELNVYNQELEWAERNLEIIGQKYAMSYNAARRAAQAYEKSAATIGTGAEATQKLKTEMLNAQAAELKLEQAVEKAGKAFEKAEIAAGKIPPNIDDAANKQNKFNNAINNGSNKMDNLASKVKRLVSGYLGFQAVKKGMDLTIGGAARLEQQLITISGMLGNKDVGKAFFGQLNKYANESVYGLKEFNTITRSFIQFTKNTDKLMGLNKTAEKLAFLDPSQGLEGAGFALKEALGGDFMSLKSRFGFGKADAEILKASKDMDDFINKFNKLLAQKGATDKALQEFNQSAVAQMNNLKSNIETAFAQAGEKALEILKPLLSKLNEGFKEGRFQSFFDGITIGLTTIVTIVVGLIDTFSRIGEIVQNNWGVIEPIIWGIVAAMIVYNATSGIAWLTTIKNTAAKIIHTAASWAETAAIFAMIAAQDGLNAALAACPLSWIIISMIILIAIFYAAVGAVNHFAGTSLSATGIIVGSIAFAGAFILNTIIGVINAIIQFIWTRFVEPFIGIIEWVLNVANGGFNSFGGAVANLIGQITSWFLSLGKVVTKIIDAIFGTDWTGGLSSLQDNVLSWGKNETAITLDRNAPNIDKRIGYGNAWNAGYGFGENVANKFDLGNMFNKGKIPEVPKMPDLDAWNAAQGPGQLSALDDGSKKHLKNIDDKIDISNEQLELMRDLAEQESIQNFVTLTPTVEVTTGDIKEEADVNKIIAKIENYMENELVNSAEGAYA